MFLGKCSLSRFIAPNSRCHPKPRSFFSRLRRFGLLRFTRSPCVCTDDCLLILDTHSLPIWFAVGCRRSSASKSGDGNDIGSVAMPVSLATIRPKQRPLPCARSSVLVRATSLCNFSACRPAPRHGCHIYFGLVVQSTCIPTLARRSHELGNLALFLFAPLRSLERVVRVVFLIGAVRPMWIHSEIDPQIRCFVVWSGKVANVSVCFCWFVRIWMGWRIALIRPRPSPTYYALFGARRFMRPRLA